MATKQSNSFLKATPIFLAFLCMGFGDVVGPLTSLVKEEFNLSLTMANLIPFMGFIMFGLLSVPMGIYQDKKGKKFVLTLGLILAVVGLVAPILGNFSSFALVLLSILLLGAGATILQVAGNPIMRDVSAEGKYSRNLSLGQFIKSIASLSGALIPMIAVRYFESDWKVLFPIYASITLLAIIFLVFTKIEEKQDEDSQTASFSSCLKLLNNKYILMMVLAIFLYVGAEVCMSSGLPTYLKDRFDVDLQKMGLFGTLFFFLALMAGRGLGSIILNWVSPQKFLKLTVILSLIGIAGLFIAPSQVLAFVAIFIIGLGFANIFPLVFSITVDHMPERANEISGLMVTAIVGGAFIPPLMGVLGDATSVVGGFIIPLLCIGYIMIVAAANRAK